MTDLYRHHAEDGTLLYVGISLSALARLVQHRRDAHWYREIASVQIERFPTREAAEAAEKLAIENEKPLFNIMFSLEAKEARRAARAKRAETVAAQPNPAAAIVKRDKHAIAAAFWEWRSERRAQDQGSEML